VSVAYGSRPARTVVWLAGVADPFDPDVIDPLVHRTAEVAGLRKISAKSERLDGGQL
jgi:hypothetical protein